MIEEALTEARRLAHEHRLEGKDLDELDDLEDEEDEQFLEQYKRQRMAELSTTTRNSIFNQVYYLQKPDYAKEVTEASTSAFVFVLLVSSLGTNTESALLTNIWRELAVKFGDVKFCQMRADLCIEGYPEKNTPTILVYKDEDIKRQIVTLKELKGTRTSSADLEDILTNMGAVKHSDARLEKKIEEEQASNGGIRNGRKRATANDDDDDSDWD